MSSRSPFDGSVFKTSNGRWAAQVELPRGGDGKRRRIFRRARTRAQALETLRELREEFNRTGNIANARRTVAEATELYRSERSGSDQDQWSADLIVAGLGSFRLVNLSVEQCDDFLRSASKGLEGRKPISPTHLRKLRQFLVATLRNEMRVGNVARNVGELSRIPATSTKSASDRRSLDHKQLHDLLQVASGSRLILIELIGRNGLRPAEARALRWSDIDFDRSELSVSGQLNRENLRTTPKTNRSFRTIKIDQRSIDRLKDWADTQTSFRDKAGTSWSDLDIVASTNQGTPVDRHSLARSLRILCKHADITPGVTP